MIHDMTPRAATAYVPTVPRDALVRSPLARLSPSYTFFFGKGKTEQADEESSWPSFEDPRVTLESLRPLTRVFSSYLPDVCVLKASRYNEFRFRGLVPPKPPWAYVLLEDDEKGPYLKAHLMERNNGYRTVTGRYREPPLQTTTIKYVDDGRMPVSFESASLIAALIWPTTALTRYYLEHLFWNRKGGFFNHIWVPQKPEHHRDKVVKRVTGGVT